MGVSVNTIKQWCSILAASFVSFELKPYFENIGKRLLKSPKIYFNDTGLLTSLLDMSMEKIFMSNYWGAVLENFIFMELQKQLTWSLFDAKLLHFRTTSGTEVDIIAEKRDGTIVGIEIKAAASVAANDLKG